MSLKRENTENIVYEGIVSLIMNGKIQPGSRLVEQQIADELHVSRTPVRNAMRTLASEGLIEEAGHGGYSLFSLSRKDVRELYRVKSILEPQIAVEAAKNAPPTEKDYYLNLLDMERECYFEGKTNLYVINKGIHCGIAKLSGNKHMQILQSKLYWRSEIYTLFFDIFYHGIPGRTKLRNPDISVSHQTHKELIEAIFAHNTEKAEDASRRHIASSWVMLVRNMESLKDGYGKMLISDWDEPLTEDLP